MRQATASTGDEVREYCRRALPFYEAELKDRGDGDFWAWAASEPAGCRVLEPGAGTGRATEFLARRGEFGQVSLAGCPVLARTDFQKIPS